VKPEGSGADRILDHRLRLAICVLLTRFERLSFSRLKELTEETDGNLGANLRRLEEVGFIEVAKEFVARKPVSWYAITPRGEKTLKAHLDDLSQLIAQAGRRAPSRRSS
jgi:DNA-binding PadR family transcriptional regulator